MTTKESQMSIADLRKQYHEDICAKIIRANQNKSGLKYPNFADGGSVGSIEIASRIVQKLSCTPEEENLTGQTAGAIFEKITRDFIAAAFGLLLPLRPGHWQYSTHMRISDFEQYAHLAELDSIIRNNNALKSAFGGDYIITPDIVVGKWPVSDEEINAKAGVIETDGKFAKLTPFRSANYAALKRMTLHASISCKWTIRSDRSQNARTEALNLIRNRKGMLPHISVVTAEPTPWRLASIALGTGDLDCVYHFALQELIEAVQETNHPDYIQQLMSLVEGKRLRDISDLPFDLAL
jgi:hypothetical protein